MKKFRKVLALTLCAAALVGASVMGTMAYLQDSDVVTNTFTVGKVGLELDEAVVNEQGEPLCNGEVVGNLANADRTEKVDGKEGNAYHLMPGGVYTKDPTVTVTAGSEDSYVRMLVEVNNIGKLKTAFGESYVADGVFLLQNLVDWNTDWQYVKCTETNADSATIATYEFRYVGNDTEKPGNGIVVKNTADTELPALFTTITIPGELDKDAIANLAGVEIKVTAHAIQEDGFKDADAAWAAFDE